VYSEETLGVQADILIVSNGPGELASWVHPVVRQFRRLWPEARLIVALVPCPYASGEEPDSLRLWPERVNVWTPSETMRYVFSGRAPEGFSFAPEGAVVFLGGDQIFGVIASRRTGYPLYTYTETAARWRAFTRRFLVSDRNLFLKLRDQRLSDDQLTLVGNLMVDAVKTRLDPLQTRKLLGLRSDALVLGLLPGSKPFKVRYVTPLFLRVVELLQAENPALQVVLHRSQFTPREQLAEAIEEERFRLVTGGASGRLEREGTIDWIVTDGGARIQVIPPDMHDEGLGVIDMALTVPGTNTAELAVLGVPMVVALPLHKPEEIPIDGLAGQLGAVPWLGPALKRSLARAFLARRPLVALPNQRAGAEITPEVLGAFAPETLADAVRRLLDEPVARREVKLQLHAVMGSPGAAQAVVDTILADLGHPAAASMPEDPAASSPEA
jgi:lipid-A-disaccharide synthase